MKHYDLIQVLWVEDDEKVTKTYPVKAKLFGLQLVPYACWDDAKVALKREYDRWSAIILDAKCKYHQNSADNATKFLGEALNSISKMASEQKRVIPWYILTGGDESEVSDSIIDDRLEWDGDWTAAKHKNYYSKATDRDELYRRIRYHASISPRLQIQKMYRNVFGAIEECKIDNEANNALEDLLVPIHFQNEIDASDYNDKFKKARVVLEYIFRSMIENGMLPDWGNNMNTRWSSCILAGKPAVKYVKDGDDIIVVESKEAVLPAALNHVVRAMVNILPADVHSKSGDSNAVNIPDYIKSVDSSTCLLNSFALQLCDLILWYRNFLRDHCDKEQNELRWEIKEPKYMSLRK